jgi:putative redox protein
MEARIEQIGSSTSKATVRTHSAFIDRPVAKGGEDRGPAGGEYLLVAWGGCFMSHLLAGIKARDAQISDVTVSIAGTLDGTPERFTEMTLTVEATHSDVDLLRRLVTVAERACQVSNTLREAVPLSVVVREPLAEPS